MKSRWKKYAAFVGGIIALIVIAVTVMIYMVYFGYYHVNGLRAAKYPIHGVDVSHYQGEIDWSVLADQDIQFAYIKATEGSSHVDKNFLKNYREARQVGLRVGAYHFFSYDSPGVTQAGNFIDTVENFDGILPPVVDVEFYGNKRDDPPAPKEVYPQLQAYLDVVEDAYGRRPIIYATYESWELYIQEQFDDYPLWIRDIWNAPKDSIVWIFWQYTNRGRMEGFSGDESYVDLNVFAGTVEEWEEYITADDGDTGEAEGIVEDLQDMPDDGILKIAIHNKEEYEEFISCLEEYTAYSGLQLYLGETDTTIYLDEILAYQNFEQLYVENGGTILFRNTPILTYSIQTIELSHVYAIEEDVLSHIMSGISNDPHKIVIELDNRNLDKLPIEELLGYDDCGDVILVWDDDTWGGGLLDVQEGMESLREWDYLQSVQEATDGCLKGIYRLSDGDYSYTCYEFYNHYEEYTADITAAFICVKDRESNGEEYFDIIDLPINKFSDLYRGTTVNRINVMNDLNFDEYTDLEFCNQNNTWYSRSGYYFLWDEEEQRFVFNESTPRYIERIDPERKRLTNSTGSSMEDDYYIYEYSDNVFTRKHLKISTDLYGKK